MERTKEELMSKLKERFGEAPTDDDISFLEDVSDTMNALENKPISGQEDWEKKYHENDEAWRKKYTERFYSGSPSGSEPDPSPANDPPKRLNFEDLFN